MASSRYGFASELARVGKGEQARPRTTDYLQNDGLHDALGDTLHLRGAVLLANAYYDIPLSGSGAAGGGWGAYLGAGAGATFYHVSVTPTQATLPDGNGWTPTVAAMAGVTYDAGSWVADLGYRYFSAPDLEFEGIAGPPATPATYQLDYTSHAAMIGLRWQFAAPAPPPPPPAPPAPPPPPPVATCPQADFVVYFEWDRSNLNQAALETIVQVAWMQAAAKRAAVDAGVPHHHAHTLSPESIQCASRSRECCTS